MSLRGFPYDCLALDALVWFEAAILPVEKSTKGYEMLLKDEFMLGGEAAEALGICPNTIRSWGATGKITEYRHPINGYRTFKKDDLERILREIHKPKRVPK